MVEMARVDDEQPRSGNVSAFDRHLDADVAVACTFSFQIAQRGKTLFQRAPGRNRRPRRAQRQRISQDVGVVAAMGRFFSLQKDVRVGIDQAGENGIARKVDDRGARGNLCSGRVGNAFDAVATNHDDLIAAGLIGFAIDEHARADDGYSLRRSGLGKRGNDERQGNNQTEQRAHVHLFRVGWA